MNNCPFCGGLNLETIAIGDHDNARWFVMCLDCDDNEGPNASSKIGAENLWNRRVNPGCTECDKNKRKLVTAISRIDEIDKPWQEENWRLHTIIEEAKKKLVEVTKFVENFQQQAKAAKMRIATRDSALVDVWESIKRVGDKLNENHTPMNIPTTLLDGPAKQRMIDYVNKMMELR